MGCSNDVYCFFSQVLVLPPYQRMGHCASLIQMFYNEIKTSNNVQDITGTTIFAVIILSWFACCTINSVALEDIFIKFCSHVAVNFRENKYVDLCRGPTARFFRVG